MIFIHLTLLVCAIGAALLVIRYDLYEREPWFMVAAAAATGGVVMWTLGFLEDFSLDHLGGSDPGPVALAAVAATHEEIARLVIVALIAISLPSQFNDPMDGLVYGSVVGIGMAVEESRLVMSLHRVEGWVLPGAEPVRVLGHLVLGGIGGFAVGMARLRMNGWPRALAVLFGISLAIHFLWDWIAFAAASRRSMSTTDTTAAISLMLVGMTTYAFLVVTGSRWSGRLFPAPTPRTVWGWPFSGVGPREDRPAPPEPPLKLRNGDVPSDDA